MLKADVITIFPKMIDDCLSESIVGRARKNKILKIGFVNPRQFAKDVHKTIDDRPYGGGLGMTMMAEPLIKSIKKVKTKSSLVILTSPRGQIFNQKLAKKLAKKKHLIFVCGHYEGVDERVHEAVDMEISLGDFILTGGELATCVMLDAIVRLQKGAFKKSGVAENESFENNLLEAPQYTRPEIFDGKKVPSVLLSGNHKKIEEWKVEQSEKLTKKFRPDLYKKYKENLSKK
ncbi:MAG: tRNA (guanosine(37)-N1)-methyltransferase TrmD [Elusimicrobiaceae bacterium]|jgi:tRNA (guanine37-N1)-methyltransferase|nr:tRNA (guanosine(37)-N1)-methyltransferase TrmD [Elusimicrobiaceae bacterium]MBT4439517.1 tRNA (guanosine(37)-N1)-methyltransferase TrmD [Elusimicrobiaceae bacterium]MBT5987253.1 tRNA (guanosine(37)-N1)-methyltransferase TrmD [Elusimicrobiaceae bacterium]MBT6714840.1 tRNA (guanosine(37)-N1)-methyltransferase TrmD [Elusimicrobiaceae bacterium]MBT7283581.1 tRNA (guanosine(37)-N1)-methyltransferase TrmD [Elusimicrobiaceae bacterium]